MISCDQHDYVEIACMYRYQVKLTLKSGEEITGIALDTRRNAQLQECIAINNTDNLIPLDSVATMAALVENPHFNLVTFT
jgi:Rho-binding antiterminator